MHDYDEKKEITYQHGWDLQQRISYGVFEYYEDY